MDKETIKSILLAHGFTIKPGETDLKPYVYKAAFELLELATPAVQGDLVAWATRLYNTAYHAGHNDTVDGGYTHVYPQDMDSYHEDIVQEWLADNPQPVVQGEPEGARSLLVECERALCCPDPAQRQVTASKVLRMLATPQPAEQTSINPNLASDAAKHLTDWLEMGLCECGGVHSCGYYEVKRTRDALLGAAEQQPTLAKYQPCGCVVCTCEHEAQCQGCGAKHCGTHPVGQLPNPAYRQQPAEQQPVAWARMKGGRVTAAFPDKGAAEFWEGFEVSDLVPLYLRPQLATEAALLEAFVAETAAQAEAAELAGALDEMIKEADLASWGGYFPATAVTRAVKALAAYRKRGGEL